MKRIGYAFKEIREKRGIAQKVAAIDLGVSATSISTTERTHGMGKVWKRQCAYYNVSPDAVLLHAVDITAIPAEYREMFKELKEKMLQ